MPKEKDKQGNKVADGCLWVYIAIVILLAAVCFVGIVAFSIWVNI
jgi:hypothetical protein